MLLLFKSGALSALRTKSVLGLVPCTYCGNDKQLRKYSTLKGQKARALLHRPAQTFHQYDTVRREHYASLLHFCVNSTQSYFEYVHAATGLDWWASLMVAVVPIRVAMTCVISALQTRNMKKVMLSHIAAMPEVQSMNKAAFTPEALYDIVKKYRAKSLEEQAEIVKKMQEEVEKQYGKRRCHPYKNFGYGIITIPFWVAGAFAIRNMTGAEIVPWFATYNIIPSMGTEGCLWFQNLLVPDDTHALPVIEWVVAQLNFEMILAQLTGEEKGWIKYYVYFIRFWQLWTTFFVWVLWNKPSGLLYYWVLTTTSNLGTNLLLRHPKVRQKLQLHIISQTPYRDIVTNIKKRYNIKQRWKNRKERKTKD